jgi:hypothetical protein
MSALPTVVNFVERVADMRFSPKLNEKIQSLMDRNNNGQLTPSERDDLAMLAALSEEISLYRAEALLLLGRKPK